MTYTREFLLSQPRVSNWQLNGDRRQTAAARGLVAVCCGCGYETSFSTLARFLNNVRRCRECGYYTEEEAALRKHQSTYMHGAKKRLLDWGISFEEFSSIVKNVCYYCGEQPKQRLAGKVWNFAGIDRIDNSLGYRIDNLRPCCRTCNVAKNNLSEEEWKTKISQWMSYLDRENGF